MVYVIKQLHTYFYSYPTLFHHLARQHSLHYMYHTYKKKGEKVMIIIIDESETKEFIILLRY
jgi:hypothetical protein